MNVAVLRFPGSNCDQDVVRACEVLGFSARYVWHREADLGGAELVVVPGGFSFGDYLRAGAIAARSPVMAATRAFAERGGPVLGICNGFQILCEAGLLPGALTRNASLRFECRDVWVRVEGRPTAFTSALPAGRVLRLPIAHAEGRYHHDDPAGLARAGQVVLRYCDAGGGLEDPASNPNGSVAAIAGVADEHGTVVGLMPHPERAVEALLGGEDGRALFACVAARLAGREVRP